MSTPISVGRRVGSEKDLGPVQDGYRPAAPSQQDPTDSPLREILAMQRARRFATADQRFYLLRDECVEWLSLLEGVDPLKVKLDGFASEKHKLDAFNEDLVEARNLVEGALKVEDPAGDYPNVEFHRGDTDVPAYSVSRGPGATAHVRMSIQNYDTTIDRWMAVDERRKYHSATKNVLGFYSKLRAIAARWALWNNETEIHPTTAASSMKNIEAAIQDALRNQNPSEPG